MPASQQKYLDNDLLVITELNVSEVPSSLPKNVTSPRPIAAGPVLERGKRLLRFFVCLYAAAMIAALVLVHVRDDRRLGIREFFISCAAGFYIICYQILSAKDGIKLWFNRNGSTFRAGSIALAALVVSIPITLIFLAQTHTRTTPLLPKPSATPGTASRVAEAGVAPSSDAKGKNASAPVPTAVQKPIRPGLVSDVRYTSDASTAVIVVDLDRETQFEAHRISSPDRIYLDLPNTRLSPALSGKTIQTADRLLRAIRVAEHEHETTRITLATGQMCDYSVSRVPGASQLRIELRKAQSQAKD